MAYRELKYDEHAIFFHSKKKDCIIGELYLSLALHNIVAYICSRKKKKLLALKRKLAKDKAKHDYSMNHSNASYVIRKYLRLRNVWTSESIIEELVREMEEIRDKRQFDRKLVPKGVIPFNYRPT